jgi:acetolactate synthase-1/2/3 large subunit
MQIKVSDVIAKFLAENTRHVFTVSGGANLHILDSLAKTPGIKTICTQHEQAASFAADAYARLTGFGVNVVTSGPGATNTITGIASSYYDSVPMLTITGQQSRSRLDTHGCRQIGFQQTPIVDMVRPITNYAYTVMQPENILYELQKAMYLANVGRPGPVVLDVPDDLQRCEVDSSRILTFLPEARGNANEAYDLKSLTDDVLMDLHYVKRPLLIYGWGVRLARAENIARKFADLLGIPIAVTWAVRDAFPDGLCFGTHGTRAGNFAVQNADYILSVGSRLDTKATSSPPSLFAPNAKLSMVEIDEAELAKMARYGRPLYRSIQADCRDFLHSIEVWARATIQHDGGWPDWSAWKAQVQGWREKHAPRDVAPAGGYVAPYALVEKLSDILTGDEVIVSDTGNTLGWMMQAFRFKGQRFLHPFNNTPMGYGLPGAMAAALATGKPVICVTGDGSIMMSLAEMATIAKHRLNVKVLLLNNEGHSMCRATQRQWLDGKYAGTGLNDLAFPREFTGLLEGFGNWLGYGPNWISAYGLDDALARWMRAQGPVLLEVPVDPNVGLSYQVRYGKALDEGESNMKEAA